MKNNIITLFVIYLGCWYLIHHRREWSAKSLIDIISLILLGIFFNLFQFLKCAYYYHISGIKRYWLPRYAAYYKMYLFHHSGELTPVEPALHVKVGDHAGGHVAEAGCAQSSGQPAERVHATHACQIGYIWIDVKKTMVKRIRRQVKQLLGTSEMLFK